MSVWSITGYVRWLVQIWAVSMIASCGGGGGGDASSAPLPAPTRGVPPPPTFTEVTETFLVQTAVSMGTYQGGCPGLGPIALATHVSTCIDAIARVTRDGRPFDIAGIPAGVWNAVVLGSLTRTSGPFHVLDSETGEVTSIDFQRVVVGTVESVDAAHARLSALGQQIYVTDKTQVYGDGTIADLAVGDRIAVSGFFSPDGEVVATAIVRDTDGTGFVLRGILHFDQLGQLRIGGFLVPGHWDYSWDGFPGSAPAEGDPALLMSELESLQFIGGAWNAGPQDIRILAGMISSRASLSAMSVAGRLVDCTFFRCDDLPQAQVGTLVADVQAANAGRVELLASTTDRIAVTGPVDAVDVPNRSLSVLGFPVQVQPATVVADDTLGRKQIDDIRIGDVVSAIGGPVGDLLVAGRIDTHADGASILTRVAEYADPDIRVLRRTIHTDAMTVVFEDCVGQRDQGWLFDVAADSLIYELRVGLVREPAGEIRAARIDADAGACRPWDY